MLYTKPSSKNRSRAGYLETYNLESENMKFAIHTIVGGFEDFDGLNNRKRFAYVLRGKGNAVYIPEKRTVSTLLEGVTVDIPVGQSFKMDGQLRYALLETTGESAIRTNRRDENTLGKSGDDSTIVFITEGIGNAYVDGKVFVLREESLLEIPPHSTYELRGNFEYIIARG